MCTIFVHVDGVRSSWFGLWTGINFPRSQFTRIIHNLPLLLLGLCTEGGGEGEREEGGGR